MSTRSILARVGEHEGKFSGRYVHADGSPGSIHQQKTIRKKRSRRHYEKSHDCN